jgi:symplekin
MAGVTTLRDIINLRPPVRDTALQILLDLTSHPGISFLLIFTRLSNILRLSLERKIRVFAINTVKRWVPSSSNISPIVTNYALQMVRRLGQTAGAEAVKSEAEEVEEGEEEEETIESTYVPAKLELPLSESVIQQHVELLLALSVRNADLLET